MKYISVYDHMTGKRLAFLQNAFNIGYSIELNALWTARFSLPYSDPKRKYCDYFNFIELWDGDRNVGLFRIMPAAASKHGCMRAWERKASRRPRGRREREIGVPSLPAWPPR